jgi:hypothetical protein
MRCTCYAWSGGRDVEGNVEVMMRVERWLADDEGRKEEGAIITPLSCATSEIQKEGKN